MQEKQTLPKLLASLCFAVSILGLPSCTDEEDGSATTVSGKELSLKKVIVSVKATDQPEKLLAVKNDMENFLSEKLKRVVEISIPTSTDSVSGSLVEGKIDVGLLNPTDAARNLESGITSVLLGRTEKGSLSYKSIWVCKREKQYSDMADLKNKPIAFASRSSEPGYLIPAWDLAKKKLIGPDMALTDYFSQVLYCNGDASAVEKVLAGDAEAAAIADFALQDGRELLSEGQKAQLKTLQEQGPVATDVLCVRSSLSPSDRKLLKEAFLRLNTEKPELCNRAFQGNLEEVNRREHLEITLEAIEIQNSLKH